MTPHDIPLPAKVLGYAGLIPFLASALAAWILPYEHLLLAQSVQVAYGAVILSFMGAVHWGLAMAGTGVEGRPWRAMTWKRLGGSVVPALIGWLALLIFPLWGQALLFLGFVLVFLGDVTMVKLEAAPPWYPKLRKPLTVIVLSSLLVCYLAFQIRFQG